MGDETIVQGEDGYPIINELLCTGCGICPKKCPYKAIKIINTAEELGQIIHQYGKNSFRLYNLPSPKKAVIGIVGRNSIGKSTLVRILAGEIKPNLGHHDNAPSWDEILAELKGHEIHGYLKALSEKKAKLSYKPQDIDAFFEGRRDKVVGDVLKVADEKGVLDEYISLFELEEARKRKVSELSGGELQRLAIAITMMKEADYYFFDEPSSYLDVRQRIKVAKLLRRLGEDKTVFIVEHDLAILDYLTDYVHILFGEPGVYGVVSGLKTSRAGINEFLDGFLKAENIRIRDYSISFPPRPPAEEWKNKEMFEYGAFRKDYPGFTLEVEGGEIKRGECIGILGPNAIGKSTFFKVLAGIEKTTEGEPGLKLRIAYKPQYVKASGHVKVMDFIRNQDIDMELFNSLMRNTVEDLMEKELENLSGGELQRLAITLTLAKRADLCLLDEPSAFLDIEQRLRLAELIKRVSEKKEEATMVIDHDIIFIDAVSNRIINFEGKPGRYGRAKRAKAMEEGMNDFLKMMEITFRRDPSTGRPRINKKGSQKDIEQRKSGRYYYSV